MTENVRGGRPYVEIPLSPIAEVRHFLRMVWNHPLLDKRTVDHRRQFPDKFLEWCQALEVDSEQVVGVPVGSIRWIVNGCSDWDFVLYGPGSVLNRYIEATGRRVGGENCLKSPKKVAPVEIIREEYFNKGYLVAPLLLTPDKYLGGNSGLAAEYRRQIVKFGEKNWRLVGAYFVEYMKYWVWAPQYPDKAGEDSRFFRLNKALGRKARELASRYGRGDLEQRYKESFASALEKLQPPSLDIYRQAIETTGGKLEI